MASAYDWSNIRDRIPGLQAAAAAMRLMAGSERKDRSHANSNCVLGPHIICFQLEKDLGEEILL